MPWIDDKNIIYFFYYQQLHVVFPYRFLWNPKKRVSRSSLPSLHHHYVATSACLQQTLPLSLARIRSARSRNSVEPTTLPPPPPISRVISSSSTIALESHCSTSILQSNLPPLPVPWALQTPNLLFRNRIRDRDGTRSSSSIPRGGYEGKLRIPGESSASIGVRTNGNELTFCQDARWSLSNRNSLIHCDAPIYLFCGELSIYGLREGKWISKAGLNMAVVFARFRRRRSWNSCFVFIRSFYNICN